MTQQEQNPVVHMKCRRGHDRATEGQSCKGMRAEKLAQDGAQTAAFKCTTCQLVWHVPLGGFTPI